MIFIFLKYKSQTYREVGTETMVFTQSLKVYYFNTQLSAINTKGELKMKITEIKKACKEALLLSETQANRLAAIFSGGSRLCYGIGLASGAGLAGAVSKDVLTRPGDPRGKALAIGGAALVGFSATFITCQIVYNKINAFFDEFETAELAITCITPERRQELRNAAFELLAKANKKEERDFMQAYEEGRAA